MYGREIFFLDDHKLSVEQICQLLDQAPRDCEQLFLLEHGIDLEYGDGNYPPKLGIDSIEVLYAIHEHIAGKLGKVADGVLRSSSPIEILAYFESPWAATRDWEQLSEQLRGILTGCLLRSQVRRIWVFDPQAEVIRFAYPLAERVE